MPAIPHQAAKEAKAAKEAERRSLGGASNIGGIAGDQLISYIGRAERLAEERKTLNADIKEVLAEAKGAGFDVKILRKILQIRSRDQDDLDEENTLLDLYLRSIGMKSYFEITYAKAIEKSEDNET